MKGLTIVADGAGHGGLTFCQGGNAFLYDQAGYLGAAVFGCLLILLGQYPRLAKAMLVAVGISIATASFFLMPLSLFQSGMVGQGILSMGWGLAMALVLIGLGIKLKAGLANVVLLFLAVQTALNSVTCIGDLIALALGLGGVHAFSDATNMADMTGIPALCWSIFWGISSIVMVGFTVKETYGRRLISGKKPVIKL